MKHTAGPWELRDSWESHPHHRGERVRDILILAGPGEASICFVASIEPQETEIQERELANARLIAAAPDLLAALRAMVASYDGIRDTLTSPIVCAKLAAADAAIAKAEGQELASPRTGGAQ